MRAVLVPVKSFGEAKHRLSSVLDDATRRSLARRLAEGVLDAARPLDRYVACDDDEVADWAISRDVQVLWTPGLGLSGAVQAGVAHLGKLGFDLAVVAHGDLPLVKSFSDFGAEGEVTLAPDRRLDGTNVAAVPTASSFTFAYGPGSFARHRVEAERLGLRLKTVFDWQLACDVDVPSDLELVGDLLEELTSPVPQAGG